VKNFLTGLWVEFANRWEDPESNIRIIVGTTVIALLLFAIVCAT